MHVFGILFLVYKYTLIYNCIHLFFFFTVKKQATCARTVLRNIAQGRWETFSEDVTKDRVVLNNSTKL